MASLWPGVDRTCGHCNEDGKEDAAAARTLGRSESEERAGVRKRDRSSGVDGGTRTRKGTGTLADTHILVITMHNARYVLTDQHVPTCENEGNHDQG